jgi:hypothetical protein
LIVVPRCLHHGETDLPVEGGEVNSNEPKPILGVIKQFTPVNFNEVEAKKFVDALANDNRSKGGPVDSSQTYIVGESSPTAS